MPDDQTSQRTSREDWLNAARVILTEEGIDQVKILRLAELLGVSRSSFYWFFSDRNALLAALLNLWGAHNTGSIVARAEQPSATITKAVLRVFECWVDPRLFDAQLDFAIREWARRDEAIRADIDAADSARLSALSAMFRRHGFAPQAALVRARILYFTQVGYFALVTSESMAERRSLTSDYVLGFTGLHPSSEELDALDQFLQSVPPDSHRLAGVNFAKDRHEKPD